MFVVYKHRWRTPKCRPNFFLDREELEEDGENKYEPVNFEESEDLSTCTNQNLQEASEFDPTVDNSKTSGEECISNSVQAAKIEPSQATFQPQVKTIEKIQTGNSYRKNKLKGKCYESTPKSWILLIRCNATVNSIRT